MTEEYTKQVLQIQDIEPDVISPLIMEMVSNIDWTVAWSSLGGSEATLALAQVLNINLSTWNNNIIIDLKQPDCWLWIAPQFKGDLLYYANYANSLPTITDPVAFS